MKTSIKPFARVWCTRLCLSVSVLFTLAACGGGSGVTGLAGTDAALRTTPVSAGSQCADGGVQVESGLDANRNGQLDSSEVTGQTVMCNAAPGSAGVVGGAGLTGASTPGSAGPQGTAGATGSTGTTGATGAAGAAGTVGIAGAAGTAGTTGSAGPAGATGAAGAVGTTGAAGAIGPVGTSGATGVIGAAGTSGTNGAVPTSFNAPPAARVALSANGLILSVSAAASSDAGGTITSYVWNFGEPASASNSANGITATHTYAAAGSYQVTLLVTDNQGGPAINQQTVTITTGVPVPVATGKLNDTGITASQCYSAGSNALVTCTSAGAISLNAAQDGMQGRDVAAATNSAADGKLGFAFTKIAANGQALPASATSWACVQDNVTGKVWEVKTTDGGLRDWTKTYTNYDSTASAQFYNGTAYVNPTQVQIDAATNSVGFKNAVNAVGLCGATDWRLPTPDELQGLVDYGVAYPGPTIDATWFPNTQGNAFWSSSPYVGSADGAWYVVFDGGYVYDYGRFGTYYVRLVRAGQ